MTETLCKKQNRSIIKRRGKTFGSYGEAVPECERIIRRFGIALTTRIVRENGSVYVEYARRAEV